MVSFEQFKKVDMRVGEIKKVEEVEGTKLYKMIVDADRERTLVAGLKPYYNKEELIGKKVVVVVNLEPKKIRGILSEGMVLAAVKNGKVVLIGPMGDIENGARIE